jgi:hypothetical protein
MIKREKNIGYCSPKLTLSDFSLFFAQEFLLLHIPTLKPEFSRLILHVNFNE